MLAVMALLCALASGCSVLVLPLDGPASTRPPEKPRCNAVGKLVPAVIDTAIGGVFLYFLHDSVARHDGRLTDGGEFARDVGFSFAASAATGYLRAKLCSKSHRDYDTWAATNAGELVSCDDWLDRLGRAKRHEIAKVGLSRCKGTVFLPMPGDTEGYSSAMGKLCQQARTKGNGSWPVALLRPTVCEQVLVRFPDPSSPRKGQTE